MSGAEGDPFDAGVQNERTALAWQRTGLALFGVTVLAGRYGLRHWPVLTGAALAPTVVLCGAILHLSSRRYRRAMATRRGGAPGPGGRLPFLTAAAVTVLGLAALAAVVAGPS